MANVYVAANPIIPGSKLTKITNLSTKVLTTNLLIEGF